MQLVVHGLIGIVLLGVGYGQWQLLRWLDERQAGDSEPTGDLATLYVAFGACGTLAALQTLFGWVAAAEPYGNGRTRLHVTLLRCYLLELVLGGVLLAYWLQRSSVRQCWETHIGQEIYRLVVVDFVISVPAALVWNGARWAIWRWLWSPIGRPEFDLAKGSLGLVFNQSLLWAGMLYAPVLATVVALKMAITFYAKEVTLMYLCRPSKTLWRSAQTATLFLVMVFVSLLAVMMTDGFVITR